MEQKKKRSTRQQRRSGLIINVLTLIVLVLVVFEGKSLISLFSRENIQERIRQEEDEVFASANLLSSESEETEAPQTGSDAESEKTSEAQTEEPETEAVVLGRENGIPDITKGSFVTAVGMELENFYTDAQIATAQGNALVMDALKNINFSKIYMMLGTNELGAYDMDAVKESYRKVLSDIKTRSASADPVVYVYSVIYVEEPLVTTGDYVNNANVDTINLKIMEMCKEEGYHYINVNEVLSDGSHSLISGAASDGIHLNQEYCRKWLDYTKTHYVPTV